MARREHSTYRIDCLEAYQVCETAPDNQHRHHCVEQEMDGLER